jgi:large subunit ribosomal protein L21
MTYAIIELGGKQYRVEKGDSVLVDRVDAEEGAKLSPRALLYSDAGKDAILDGPELGKVKVEAVVAEHLKGEKIRVFKYRPKKRYRRTQGHRSHLTRLEIGEISVGAAARKPAAKADTAAGEEPKSQRAAPKRAAAAKKDEAKPSPEAAAEKEAAKPDSKNEDAKETS